MDLNRRVKNRIEKYQPKGGLDQTAKIIFAITGINHLPVQEHCARVALLSEAIAKELKKDELAAFFGGLLHDVGKITQPHDFFDGHNISQEEYEEVKKHALAGFEILKESHLFVALCAGLHHGMYYKGYGLTIKDFPKDWHMGTVKKILELSAIVGICDFVDAFTHRTTKLKDGSDQKAPDLKGMLCAKYPDDIHIIDIALKKNKELGFV